MTNLLLALLRKRLDLIRVALGERTTPLQRCDSFVAPALVCNESRLPVAGSFSLDSHAHRLRQSACCEDGSLKKSAQMPRAPKKA